MTALYGDDKHIVYIGQRGVMLYYHRSTIDKVGGFDPAYGCDMYKHPDLALRTYNAGLSTRVFMDVIGSEKLIYSMDECEEDVRSIPRPEREALARANTVIYNDRRDNGYTAYVSFRKQRNVVITTLLTSRDNPQCQVRMKASPELVQGWTTSIRGADAVVLADELDAILKGVDLFKVSPLSMSPYFARWLYIYQLLRAYPKYRLIWCTDGTDAEMLREPWTEMQSGKIYVGSEYRAYADEWMKLNYHDKTYSEFAEKHINEPLLNAELLGDSRDDVMEFVHRIIRQYYLIEDHHFWRMEIARPALVDIDTFGTAAKSFSNRAVVGPKVHTILKTDGIGKEFAWSRHK